MSKECLGAGHKVVAVGICVLAALSMTLGCADRSMDVVPQPEPRAVAEAPAKPVATPAELDLMLEKAKAADVAYGQRAQALQAVINTAPGTPQSMEARKELEAQAAAALAAEEAKGDWEYHASPDALTGKTVKTAQVESSNTLSFDFPYQGMQRGTLVVRNHPEHGKDVVVSIEKGQILCSTYGDCPVRLVFDGGSPLTLEGNEPADNSTTHVFLPGYKNLTGRMAKAKEMRVAFNVYQQGAPVLVFNVRGLDMKKL